jgi:hypothetical protein
MPLDEGESEGYISVLDPSHLSRPLPFRAVITETAFL